jgi:hypothetical protein
MEKQKETSRLEQGANIALYGRIVKYKDENEWLVQSEYNKQIYFKVKQDGSCECEDSVIGYRCKHYWAVKAKSLIPRAVGEVVAEA